MPQKQANNKSKKENHLVYNNLQNVLLISGHRKKNKAGFSVKQLSLFCQ